MLQQVSPCLPLLEQASAAGILSLALLRSSATAAAATAAAVLHAGSCNDLP